MTERKTVGIYLTSMTMGGAERVAVNLCTGLVDRGYDVDLVLVNAIGELLEDIPSEVEVVDLNSDRVLRSFTPLRKYLNSRQPDILYSMMTEPNLVAIAANQFSEGGTRLVVSEHNMLTRSVETLKDEISRWGAWGLYPLADEVVAVSDGVRSDLIANTRLEADEVTMIYNPVAVDSIREQAKEPLEHPWFSNDEIDVVLAGGRHEPQKGFDTLLDAFDGVDRTDVRLVLFGTGPETAALKSQADSLGITERVEFTGFVENPYKYMAATDIFVLSSNYEGFGLVLIEALACGCPVVSTNCESGPAEILEDGVYGPLVPVSDDGAIADAIADVLKQPLESQMLRDRADDFNVAASMSQYDSLFQRLDSRL